MWPSSCACLLLAASQSLAVVIRATPNPAHNKRYPTTQGATIKAGYVPVVNGNGTLESIPTRYVTTIALNSREFRVAIDTGSSDLWLVTSSDFQYDTNGSQPVQLDYGAGSVFGATGFAQMQLADYSFPQQAFMNATTVNASGIVNLGLDGLLGLSFDGPITSPITRALAGESPTAGQPFLYNIFDSTPEQDNFMGISLSRTDDLEGSAEASFTINELDAEYANISETPRISLFPGDNLRWSVLIERIIVNGVDVPLVSTVPNAPNGTLVTALDTGTPTATLPPDILYGVYSQIPGASVAAIGDNMEFIIPCNTSTIITIVIGQVFYIGMPYPIHPLDLSDVQNVPNDDGSGNATFCTSTFGALTIPPREGIDALFGDSFMRNVYTVFNFGNSIAKSPSGAASMQLLSQTDVSTAIADVLKVRMGQLATAPPEFQGTPAGFIPATPGSPRPTDTSAASGSNTTTSPGGNTCGSDTGAIRTSGDITYSPPSAGGSDGGIPKYALIIIGLLAGNMVLLLILAAIGAAVYIKAGRRSGRAARYVPVKIRDDTPRKSEAYQEERRYSD
ncbi:aspartic peptidase domain-containing protein [Mycena vulgaris]|nr:aspartic peptidase domain-containing protein [Mycena vulgaris]